MDWKFLFFSTDNRIGQKDFWIGLLILFGANIVAGLVPIIGWFVSLALIWCAIALTAKRLHDFGKSGWLQVAPMALCMIIGTVGVIMTSMGVLMASLWGGDPFMAMAAFSGLFGLISIISLIYLAFLLWVGLSRGDAGPNQYGPAPTRSQFDSPPPAPPSDAPPPAA
ncbi:DUF805 domain-containing protein [Caulobacter segnis]|uniref:DUF805 domain-containing protein n=1 Tax=Caulobacter segnis TaxID=88688 RepID=UPI00241026CB|nr:DUF805 domain-containing protein [Caulobacter segnis]MDG2522571.1 DUF805 domain-containing protein [Caulobacter segnis]